MEITIHLTHVVNGGRLVGPFEWLALQHGKVYRLLKTLLNEAFPQHHCPVHLTVSLLSSNKMKHTFEPCTHYCHMHLACTSVCYEGKMHVLIIRKQSYHSK